MRAKVNEALASSQLYEETPPQILDVRAALYAAPGGGDDQSALRGTSICAGELIPIFVVFDKDVSVYASSRTSPPYALELDVGNGRTVLAPLSTGSTAGPRPRIWGVDTCASTTWSARAIIVRTWRRSTRKR